MKQEMPKKKDRRMLTLFILIGLSFLIALEGFAIGSSYKVILQVVTIFIQTVILKNILDDYYENL